jgi:hypothetical protein
MRQVQRLIGMPLLFAVGTACVFCVSNISAAGLLFPCTRDEVGRYAAPLFLVLPFLFAAVVTAIYLCGDGHDKSAPTEGGWNDGGEHDKSVPAGRVAIGQGKLINGILIACVVIYLAAQAVTYIRANPVYTFQSFACQVAPVDNGPIISYMQKEHMRYAWGAVWIGNAIVFKTDSKIMVADPRIITVHANNRIPANTAAVLQADRPAILAFALHSDAHPDLLRDLSRQGVAYTVARFPAVQGLDVLVVQPDRTLPPSTANALGSWFYNC